MDNANDWLDRLAKLNVYKARHGQAPHKPLLLLVLLDLIEHKQLTTTELPLTPELSFRFDTFARVVTYRRTQRPDVRMPFFHLQSDGVLIPYDAHGNRATHRSVTNRVVLNGDLLVLMGDPKFREQARRILIAKYFAPIERLALKQLVGLDDTRDDDIQNALASGSEEAKQCGREARFRLDIVPTYNYSCALTGYRITTLGAGAIVDAAHIHEFASSRNNDIRNGLALCKNAHWLFDAGLWTISDEFKIVVAIGQFSEDSPDQRPLSEYHGASLRLPAREEFWPDKRHLAWHREERFLG